MRRITAVIALITVLLLEACGATQTSSGGMETMPMGTAMPMITAEAGGAVGMDHGDMALGDAPYDAQFIDGMIIHHQGAIDMANEALTQAERQEVKDLSANIVKAQEAEIAQLREWRSQWYPDLSDTGGMGVDMGDMEIGTDSSKPFDQRFIEAMIPHHQSAIAMAQDAQQKAEHAEIRALADTIITDQKREIVQMQQWLSEWFGQ